MGVLLSVLFDALAAGLAGRRPARPGSSSTGARSRAAAVQRTCTLLIGLVLGIIAVLLIATAWRAAMATALCTAPGLALLCLALRRSVRGDAAGASGLFLHGLHALVLGVGTLGLLALVEAMERAFGLW